MTPGSLWDFALLIFVSSAGDLHRCLGKSCLWGLESQLNGYLAFQRLWAPCTALKRRKKKQTPKPSFPHTPCPSYALALLTFTLTAWRHNPACKHVFQVWCVPAEDRVCLNPSLNWQLKSNQFHPGRWLSKQRRLSPSLTSEFHPWNTRRTEAAPTSCPLMPTREPWHVRPLRLNVNNSKKKIKAIKLDSHKCSIAGTWETEAGKMPGLRLGWITEQSLASHAGSVRPGWSQKSSAPTGSRKPCPPPPRSPRPLDT